MHPTSRTSPPAPPHARHRGTRTGRAALPALALLLAACTAGADAPDTSSAPDAVTSAAAPSASPVPPVVGGASAECLAGTWHLDLAAMQADLQRVTGDGVDVAVEGTATYEFAEGGVLHVDADSSSSVTMSAGAESLTSTSISSGRLTGTWSLDGDQLVVSDVDTDALEVVTSASTDEDDVDVPAGSADDTIGVLPPTLSTVGCSADRASLVTTLVTDEEGEAVSLTYPLHR